MLCSYIYYVSDNVKVKVSSKLTCAVHAAQSVKLQYIKCSSLFSTCVDSRQCGEWGREGKW